MPLQLFPAVPEDLAAATPDELRELLDTFRTVALSIQDGSAELGDLSADDVVEQMQAATVARRAVRAELDSREEAEANFSTDVNDLAAELSAEDEPAPDDPEPDDPAPDDPDAEAAAAADAAAEASAEEPEAETEPEAEPVAAEAEAEPEASAEVAPEAPARRRALPETPARFRARERSDDAPRGAEVVAIDNIPALTGGQPVARRGAAFDRMSYAEACISQAARHPVRRHRHGGPEKLSIGHVTYDFPSERTLGDDPGENFRRIAAAGSTMFGPEGLEVLVAAGGLCAPLTPFYDIPNFASQARPVRDALPGFTATRGGVNVPVPSTIGDITSAITVIEESEDALGGTFATKSCQDFDCPSFVETAVTIISHCREYGNLNARAWPESIAHENDLTMAAHARSAETYLLDRIKAQSVEVTGGAETLGALIYLVDNIVKATFGIRTRLRMAPETPFRVLAPYWLVDYLKLDNVQANDGNRFRSGGELVAYLRDFGINLSLYMDSATGDGQIADSAQTEAALDPLPETVEWAIFPEGAFIHLDGGSLELGLVRDSSLNETNDFQFFGENFENVFLVAPPQSAYWVSSDLCATGQFPPAGTVRSCSGE